MNKRLGLAVSTITLLAVAGCATGTTANTAGNTPAGLISGSPQPSGSVQPSGSMQPSGSARPSGSAPGGAAQPFGAGCPSNAASMASEPVATAAADNPALAALVAAIKAAGLEDTLNQIPDATVFAPNNDAFAKIPAGDLAKLLGNPSTLKNILQYHVVSGKIAPNKLAGTHTTLEGQTLTVTGSGTNFTVNGTAKIVCGNIATRNATVYIINGVLTPKQ
jgi:uncharacterized surface protein with fasciclin (FAS1) repeats